MDCGKFIGKGKGIVIDVKKSDDGKKLLGIGFIHITHEMKEDFLGNSISNNWEVSGKGDAFWHYEAILGEGFRKLELDQIVEFDIHRNSRGYNAQKIDIKGFVGEASGNC